MACYWSAPMPVPAESTVPAESPVPAESTVPGTRGARPRLLHLGNVVVDVILDVPALPERGGDVLATRTELAAGGGFNVLAAAARQGLIACYAGAHGTGPFGDLARAALAAEGIEVLQDPRPDRDTGFVVTAVDAAGERTFLTSPGAEATLTDADLAPVRPAGRDIVYLSGYGLAHPANAPVLARWLARLPGDTLPGETLPARALVARALVAFDPGPLAASLPGDELAAVLARTDWLTCNAREAALLTGEADPVRAARVLADRLLAAGRGRRDRPRSPGVVVRTGPGGCVLAAPAGAPEVIPGFPVTPVDTNGAGDAHAGVFLAGLAAGLPPPTAARRANAAAALAVTRRGPATCPVGTEVTRFLADRDRR